MKRKPISSIWLICLIALMVRCAPEDVAEPELPAQRNFRDLSYEQIPGVVDALTTQLGIKRGYDELSTSNEDGEVLIKIDWERIVELTDSAGRVNYTFAVDDEDNAPYTFHNLVIGKTLEGEYKRPYLLTYIMSEEFKVTYDQTGSIKGFNGKVLKRYFSESVFSTPRGNSSDPSDTDPRSTDGDPCDKEGEIGTNNTSPGTLTWSTGAGTICEAKWIDYPSEPCESDGYNGCVQSIRSVFVTECRSTEQNNSSDTDPCPDDDGEVAVVEPAEKPCPGDPVPNPEIAPQTYSKVKGARYGDDARKQWNANKTALIDKGHYGVDLKNSLGDPVHSMFDGTIIDTGEDSGGWGNWIMVKSTVGGQDIIMLYAHLDKYTQTSGTIKAGGELGKAGNSGNLKDAIKKGKAIQHLHVESRIGSTWSTATKTNPENYVATKFGDDGKVSQKTKC